MAATQKKTGSTKGGKKNRKYGRNSRSPSNANQVYRTAKNKRLRIEREARRVALALHYPKVLKVPRGTARARRRFGMARQSTAA